jgi:hypothetical protein
MTAASQGVAASFFISLDETNSGQAPPIEPSIGASFGPGSGEARAAP